MRRAITLALQANPGLTELELGENVSRIDPSVSARSVGGEVRRMRDRLYRNDGGRWFLIAQVGEKETAGAEAPAGSLHADEGGTDGTALAA